MSRDRSQVLLFITVPDGEKKLKNRLHLDLRPVDVTRDEEVERLLALGASQAGDFRRPDGRGWIALTDPEGGGGGGGGGGVAGALLESVGLPALFITHDLSIVRQITAQKACTTRACEAA